ncbi:MAG TPA: ATP-binding protein [Candidatus Angelobacter sp.]|nr:ATP-binding protein [Candidatus Angelobacter sp.]
MPESSGRCRDFVRSVLDRHDIDGARDDAVLLASELCSNVIRHAGTPMVVGVLWDPVAHVVRVSVRDDAPGLPAVRTTSEDQPSGRGLRIIDRIAQRWGVRRLPRGKVVWFEVRTDARGVPHRAREAARDGEGDRPALPLGP